MLSKMYISLHETLACSIETQMVRHIYLPSGVSFGNYSEWKKTTLSATVHQ